jgi:cytochrome b561
MMNVAVGSDRIERYDRVAIALHWVIALALLGQIVFGFLLDNIAPRNTPVDARLVAACRS